MLCSKRADNLVVKKLKRMAAKQERINKFEFGGSGGSVSKSAHIL